MALGEHSSHDDGGGPDGPDDDDPLEVLVEWEPSQALKEAESFAWQVAAIYDSVMAAYWACAGALPLFLGAPELSLVTSAISVGYLLNSVAANMNAYNALMDPPRWDAWSGRRQTPLYRGVGYGGLPHNAKAALSRGAERAAAMGESLRCREQAEAARIVGDSVTAELLSSLQRGWSRRVRALADRPDPKVLEFVASLTPAQAAAGMIAAHRSVGSPVHPALLSSTARRAVRAAKRAWRSPSARS